MLGFAAMRGRGLDEDPNLLVIWDGTPGSTGGTGELVEAWREEFNEPEIIDSNTILDNSSDPEPVRIHSGETRPNFILVLEIPRLLFVLSKLCFLPMSRPSAVWLKKKPVNLWMHFTEVFQNYWKSFRIGPRFP